MTAAPLSDGNRRPSCTGAYLYEPKGPGIDPALKIHVTLVWTDAKAPLPVAIYLRPSHSAAKYGSHLHGRCEETGMMLSWLLRRGMTLDEMLDGFKTISLSSDLPLALFAVRAAQALDCGDAAPAPRAP
jgi:hypothetical protein